MRLEESNTMVLNYSVNFLSSKGICRNGRSSNRYLFTLTQLGGSRCDLKSSTRVPLDSERPKDPFGLRPTVLSQLGSKWNGGGLKPPMCVLGWGIACGGETGEG